MPIKKILVCILCLFLFFSCKSDEELAMERGIQYFEWNLIDKAIFEFNHVIHLLSIYPNELNYEKIQLLSRAHHNLAVSYAKKKWYDDASKQARTAFDLVPSKENRQVLELIQNKLSSKPSKENSN
ncbi:uncharacterized protein METZ01_LOCUS490662 [marine metagenome]|uniref:Outer membrane lipoprotein BamD-like domain-containing protein n=1 Tax=marine metagenome TaxID=408172 RepID=A0A383D1P8_9ZZZZ